VVDLSPFEQRRTPGAFRESVKTLNEAVRVNTAEHRLGILKDGDYKEYLDELVPLSCFAVLAYPDTYEVQWVKGNQGYDARVFDQGGHEVDRVEITAPHDGRAVAQDRQLLAGRGFGKVSVGKPGDDLDALVEHLLSTCRKKALVDYSDCTLVFAIEPSPPLAGYEDRYEGRIVNRPGFPGGSNL
jgi:hypothetical protein